MKELSKEQEDQIEFEANRYANDFSETSSQHPFLKRGYIAAASKYLLRVKELEDGLRRLKQLKPENKTIMWCDIEGIQEIIDSIKL